LQLPRALTGHAGPRVIAGIRPEHLSRATAKGANVLESTVSLVEPTGSETHVVSRIGEKEITSSFLPSQAPKVGDIIKLAVDMDRICLFDAETQRAIA
jgi:multiple sugar transport system ATP-binding protein